MMERRAIRLLSGAALGLVVGCNTIIGLELGEPAESVDIPCALSSDCDDGNPCTLDGCAEGRCVHLHDDGAGPDDDDPCTADACVNGAETHTIQPGLSCGEGDLLTCNAQGQCAGCTEAGDCGATTACQTWVCAPDTTCEVSRLPEGTELTDPTPNDCKTMACDSTGNAMEVPKSDDLPVDDGVECTESQCSGGEPIFPPSQADTICTDGVTFCNASGACVPCTATIGCAPDEICFDEAGCVSCTDGIQNGDEIKIDCGGTSCLKCDGDPCGGDGECVSGECEDGICISCTDDVLNGSETNVDCGGTCPGCDNGQACGDGNDCASTFCFDQVCCSASCGGACRSCDLPGLTGTCTNIPQGSDDESPMCGNNSVCNGAGSCVSDQDKKHFGEPCINNSECFNNTCSFFSCKLKAGDPCDASFDCANNNCINNVCGP